MSNSNSTKRARKKPIITLGKAVDLLGLRFGADEGGEKIPTDVSDINILCPACAKMHETRRKTMNLNFDEDVFSCARCGFSGGVYKLIAFYTGWPEKEVSTRLKKGELANYIPCEDSRKEEEDAVDVSNRGRLLSPIVKRDTAYKALLKRLTLSIEHKQDLLRRGLTELDIERIGFKSVSRFVDPTSLTKKLVTAGIDLRGVPGFGISSSGDWTMARLPDSGYLIPIRNGAGLIQGFQIRFDHPSDTIPKYGYLTSRGMTAGGTRCLPWCNWVGEDYSVEKHYEPFDVIIIEGPLKSYIVNAITGANMLAVPGVSALKQLPRPLQELAERGMRCVYIAYDMDSYSNKDVANQLNRLRDVLDVLHIEHRTLSWNTDYKGLDDYVTGDMSFLAMWKELKGSNDKQDE